MTQTIAETKKSRAKKCIKDGGIRHEDDRNNEDNRENM
jgi:hypothetical protein